MGNLTSSLLDVYFFNWQNHRMAVVETYTKLEMSFIKITSILNQILLLCCCTMSLLGFMSDIYNHDVEYNLSEEELMELDETPLMERATIVSNLLPTLSIFTAVFLLIAKYSSERSNRITNNMRRLGERKNDREDLVIESKDLDVSSFVNDKSMS